MALGRDPCHTSQVKPPSQVNYLVTPLTLLERKPSGEDLQDDGVPSDRRVLVERERERGREKGRRERERGRGGIWRGGKRESLREKGEVLTRVPATVPDELQKKSKGETEGLGQNDESTHKAPR